MGLWAGFAFGSAVAGVSMASAVVRELIRLEAADKEAEVSEQAERILKLADEAMASLRENAPTVNYTEDEVKS
jgi:hypothetical protein